MNKRTENPCVAGSIPARATSEMKNCLLKIKVWLKFDRTS